MLVRISIFFFQAEDGIRDGHVTGVQTCALPISRWRPPKRRQLPVVWPYWPRHHSVCQSQRGCRPDSARSEERRVGKECRFRCRRDDDKKKEKREVEVEGRERENDQECGGDRDEC